MKPRKILSDSFNKGMQSFDESLESSCSMVKSLDKQKLKSAWDKNRTAVQVCSDAFKLIHDIKFPDVDPKTKESLIRNCMLDSVRKTTVKLHYEAIKLVKELI